MEDKFNFGLDLAPEAMTVIVVVAVVYFLAILGFGALFSGRSKNINDYFYSGQRFPWWLVTASMIATGIGSYSFLKYSEMGYLGGTSSTMTYMNDWFVMPFFLFGWLPIIYFSRVKSIPEYFERRFNRFARYCAVVTILGYMLFYIGYNLYTMGLAIEGITGFDLTWTVPLVACILGIYVTAGGQSAVIFTDLLQGIILYFAGAMVIFAGYHYLGGMDVFWGNLPVEHRLPFTHLNANPKFSTAGIFWGEAIAGSIAFTFMNQGFIMRYLCVKSWGEAKKAAFWNVVILLPVSAIVVGCGGWIAQSIVSGGGDMQIENTYHTFMIVAWEIFEQNPLVFGFVVAALTAALMSTVDTLINACAVIGLVDIYKPLFKPEASDKHYLRVSKYISGGATVIGLLLVIIFVKSGKTLFALHYNGIMVIIPAMVTTIFLGAFWKRFTSAAAGVSMVIGSAVTVLSVNFPEMITPFSELVHGPGPERGYIYMRALLGVSVTAFVGIIVTYMTKPKSDEELKGLTITTLKDAMRMFKGGAEPNMVTGKKVRCGLETGEVTKGLALIPQAMMDTMKAKDGDLVHIEDARWYLAGLRSVCLNAKVAPEGVAIPQICAEDFEDGRMLKGRPVKLEKII